MRRLHCPSHFRRALFALQDAEGYVEALLDMAREPAPGRRAPTGWRAAPERRDAARRRAELH